MVRSYLLVSILLVTLTLMSCSSALTPAPTVAPTTAALAQPTAVPVAPSVPAVTQAPAKPAATQSAATPAVASTVTAKLDKLTFAVASVGMAYLPMHVGRKFGMYQKYGLDVDLPLVTGAAGQLQALVSNAAQVSGIQMQATITAIEKGDVKAHIIGGLSRNVPHVIVGQKEIKGIVALKGKRFGVSTVTGGEVVLVKRGLGSAGLKLEDVELIASGTPANRAVALRAGSLAGAVLNTPEELPLLDDGFNLLVRISDVIGDFPFLSYTVTDDFSKANPDLINRFLKATYEATQWILLPANKAEILKIASDDLKMNAAQAEAGYIFYVTKGTFPGDMRISDKSMQATLDLMIESGDLKVPAPDFRKYLDMSFLDKATKQ